MIDVKAFRLNQNPVDAGNFYVMPLGQFAHPETLRLRDVHNRIRHCERGYLNAMVTQPCNVSEHAVEVPFFEDFVANGESHWRQSSPSQRRVQVETKRASFSRFSRESHALVGERSCSR